LALIFGTHRLMLVFAVRILPHLRLGLGG